MERVMRMAGIRGFYFLSLFVLLGIATFGNTQSPITTVSVNVQDSSLYPAEYLLLSLENETTGVQTWQVTDSSGQCNFSGVTPGVYRLTTELMSSYQFPNPGIYRRVSRSVTVSRSTAGYDAGSDTLSLSPIVLDEYNKVIALNLLEYSTSGLIGPPQGSYTPVQNASMYSYSSVNEERNISLMTDGSGVALVGFDANDTNSLCTRQKIIAP